MTRAEVLVGADDYHQLNSQKMINFQIFRKEDVWVVSGYCDGITETAEEIARELIGLGVCFKWDYALENYGIRNRDIFKLDNEINEELGWLAQYN